MNTLKSPVSSCKCCEHYTPVGQRGGACGLLNNALVKSHWKACSFSKPVFKPSERVNSPKYALTSR